MYTSYFYNQKGLIATSEEDCLTFTCVVNTVGYLVKVS